MSTYTRSFHKFTPASCLFSSYPRAFRYHFFLSIPNLLILRSLFRHTKSLHFHLEPFHRANHHLLNSFLYTHDLLATIVDILRPKSSHSLLIFISFGGINILIIRPTSMRFYGFCYLVNPVYSLLPCAEMHALQGVGVYVGNSTSTIKSTLRQLLRVIL